MTKKSKHKDKISTLKILSPTIDISSNKEALICGCHGIIEYDEDLVRLDCDKLIISITGKDLCIRALSIEEISVSGEIIKIEFSNS